MREFLDWVYDEAVSNAGSNPGRTANKARANLQAVLSWAWEQELIETLPRLPRQKPQRDVADRHYLTKAELYFATYCMRRPHGWDRPCRWEGTGDALWFCSSTTEWIRARCGGAFQFMSQFGGGMCRGIFRHQAAR